MRCADCSNWPKVWGQKYQISSSIVLENNQVELTAMARVLTRAQDVNQTVPSIRVMASHETHSHHFLWQGQLLLLLLVCSLNWGNREGKVTSSNCENFYLRHMNIQMILYLSMCSDSDSSGPVTMAGLHAGARNASNKSFYITPSPVTRGQHSQDSRWTASEWCQHQGDQRQEKHHEPRLEPTTWC